MTIVCLEFFSGIGGLHYGLQSSGIDAQVAMSFDMNENANSVYEHNFHKRPNNKAIDFLNPQDIDKHQATCWLLSPPCQPYTRGGKYLDDEDPRARGLIHLLKLLPQLEHIPTHFFLENVMNFENSRSRVLLVETLGKMGFEIHECLMSPVQFGIPNNRLRYFLTARQTQPGKSVEESERWTAEYLGRGREAVFTQWPFDPATGKAVVEPMPPLSSYIDEANNTVESLMVPEATILKRKRLEFDIVVASSALTSTFTKGYGSKHLIGSGSLLQTRRLDIVENGFGSPERLLDLGLRFFSPGEVARLHHFPYEENNVGEDQCKSDSQVAQQQKQKQKPIRYTLSFPPSINQSQQLKLIGNSLNVHVVAQLIRFVLFADNNDKDC
ncbi:S-adenosyl-L-methionine-dependent methyltransferase [Kickxella alabastrina]|uniref:S-adenosyl-L-methionine-dependent methyltransferase n=1 Tax=Kickxella alabastrina TaxID=61397 RepID=UPI00221E9D54|nr:S-adenosyl-L-methionine-dependent methyltransferase [Kickxella alabastrina]KAI7829278.1 S-adenosyl-L-methionine-dependent methyltransferase [Kickxella alabastrina]KAJ1947803.1 hypothetical protein GGF37_000180 [Kickxella alabastrina]